MSLGLGKIAGLGILGQLFGGLGGNEKEPQPQMKGGWSPPNQQPTQVASNNTQQGQQGQGGFGGIISGFSNSMFKGMSQEQVARLGQGFNSMRLRPDDSLAASFQSTIDSSRKRSNINATVQALKKMGKPNLASLVDAGAMDVNTAMTLAFKEGKVTGDTNATIAWLKSQDPAKYPQMADYAAMLQANPTMASDILKNAMRDMNMGVTNTKDTVSAVQIDQTDGQKYVVVTDEHGVTQRKDIEGATGLTQLEKIQMEIEEKATGADAKKAVDQGFEAFQSARNAIQSIGKYKNVLHTLKNPDGSFNEDAITGWIANQFPAFTSEQALIGATANMMGIDVINMATFGALSEREMQMAMATNLDRNLSQEELYGQIVGMIQSREKLANELFKVSSELRNAGSFSKWAEGFEKIQMASFKSRFGNMPKEVKDTIELEIFNAYNNALTKSGLDQISKEAFDKINEKTPYDAWLDLNLNKRMNFIANMQGMTQIKFMEIMGNTEHAVDWWDKTGR